MTDADANFVCGLLVGALLSGAVCGIWGRIAGLEIGREQGILIGESRANAARDKEHYETCKLVRTFTPKGGPAVECYLCPASTEETCIVPSWKVAQ